MPDLTLRASTRMRELCGALQTRVGSGVDVLSLCARGDDCGTLSIGDDKRSTAGESGNGGAGQASGEDLLTRSARLGDGCDA